MFVEYIYIYIYIYEQYNPETVHRNIPKLKYFIPIKKTKHLPKLTETELTWLEACLNEKENPRACTCFKEINQEGRAVIVISSFVCISQIISTSKYS